MPEMKEAFRQRERGMMVYPRRGWRRWFFRAPLYQWRMGLGPLLGRYFLVLTTRGRKSGQPRYTMLEFSVVDGHYYLSSGWGRRTDWVRNIEADSRVTAQVQGKSFGAVAKPVSGDAELLRMYHVARGRSRSWKPYLASLGIEDTPEDFLAKKNRLTILRLDATDELMLPGLRADLAWLWLMLVAVAALFLLF